MFRGNILNLRDDIDVEENVDMPVRLREVRERINFGVELTDFSFKETFRLTRTQVDYVLESIGHILVRHTDRSLPLAPRERLLLALHWLGNGAQMHGIGTSHQVAKSTVSNIVHEVVNAVVGELFGQLVRWPDNRNDIAVNFFAIGGFPCVAGCVDGTLIKIDRPTDFEENYVDRHGTHSLNVMMICGPDYTFYAVNASWPGSCHDSRVFRNTAVYQQFEDGWRPFPGAVVLGDSAYALKEWLIPPLHRDIDDEAEVLFNRAHKRTRRMIECSFGILKERFPVLNKMRVAPQKAGIIVLACTVLHNIARTVGGAIDEPVLNEEDGDDEENVPEEENVGDHVDVGGGNRLEALLRYFRQE